jgi:hypothetical protein
MVGAERRDQLRCLGGSVGGAAGLRAWAWAVPWRLVSVTVSASGLGWVGGSASVNCLPCRGGWGGGRGCSGCWRGAEHAVGAGAPRQLHGQVSQQVCQAGQVVAGVDHDEDVGIAGLVPPGLLEPPDHLAPLGGAHRGRIVTRTQAHRVEQRAPRRAARLQRRHNGRGPAGDHRGLTFAPPVDVAERPIGAGRRVRA